MIALLHSYIDFSAHRDREVLEALGYAVAMVSVSAQTLRSDTAHALHFRTLVVPQDKKHHTPSMQTVVDVAAKVGVRIMTMDAILNTPATAAQPIAKAAPPSKPAQTAAVA